MNTHGSACTFDCANPIFQPGVTSTQVLFGAYYSSSLGPTIRAFDYTLLTIRHGWMLTGPTEFFYLPGNWEFLCDVSGGLMTSDYGNWLAGSSLYLRYNILKPDSCIVPYAQIGVGFLCQDAYRDIDDQRAVGQMFEFHLHYEIGLKYFVARNLSLDLEAGFQHLSNANWTDRNYGVNAFGASGRVHVLLPMGPAVTGPPLGAHLSIAGGVINAVTEAVRLGCGTVQLFTKSRSQWAGKPFAPGSRRPFARRSVSPASGTRPHTTPT